MKATLIAFIATVGFAVTPGFSQAKNVILFVADGAGISKLNAASICGHGKPQALYLQRIPGLALADTSTARR